MKFYFAPMEGIAGYLYRNAYNSYFHHIDKFFAPFIVTSPNGIRRTKEFKDILPENNTEIRLIPQLLSNNAKDFVLAAEEIKKLGYDEINLNMGCPSGTVTSKGRGAGFLLRQEELERFLDDIFKMCKDMKISVKTRIGFYEPEEFVRILDIYNKYPLYELIIHPRTREEYYTKDIHMETFEYAVRNTKHKLCYNGDVFSKNDYDKIRNRFPQIERVMIGRGILRNPSVIENITEGKEETDWNTVFKFHDRIYKDYKNILYGDNHILFKMKEIWFHMASNLENQEKFVKKIKKAKNLYEYEGIVQELETVLL